MMKAVWIFIILVLAVLILQGCGKTVVTRNVHKIATCTVESYKDHAIVLCPDGSYHVLKSKDTDADGDRESLVIINDCNVRQDADTRNTSKQDTDTRNTSKQDADTRQTNKQEVEVDD